MQQVPTSGWFSLSRRTDAVLYFSVMRYDPKTPLPERDYFILSKGHVTPIYYSALAESGFFDKEILWTFRKLGSPLQGHPGKDKVPESKWSGSLGQGLSIASGVALATKVNRKKIVYFVCWEMVNYKKVRLGSYHDSCSLQIGQSDGAGRL
jgi:transketolase N-terminal domain/subunit